MIFFLRFSFRQLAFSVQLMLINV